MIDLQGRGKLWSSMSRHSFPPLFVLDVADRAPNDAKAPRLF